MPFQILSLSGGGFLGYYTICVLERLEAESGAPLTEHFDLLAGTSIGGIIALALADGAPAADIRRSFEESGPRIFSPRARRGNPIGNLRDLLRGLRAPKYDHRALRDTITAVIGRDTRLGALATPVVVPTVDLADGRARLFRSYDDADARQPATDVAMATSSVPSFFPVAGVDHRLYADGGLFANAPDLLALNEAEYRLGIDPADIRMLSIGTASDHFAFADVGQRRQGLIDWLSHQRLIRIFMAAQQSSTETIMADRLGEGYLRIDKRQTLEEQDLVGLDIATREAQEILARLASESCRDSAGDDRLKAMLSHRRGTTRD